MSRSQGRIFLIRFTEVCTSSESLHLRLRVLFSLSHEIHVPQTSLTRNKPHYYTLLNFALDCVTSPSTKAFVLLPSSKTFQLEDAVFEVRILVRIKIGLLKMPFRASPPFKAVFFFSLSGWMAQGKAKDEGVHWFSGKLMKFWTERLNLPWPLTDQSSTTFSLGSQCELQESKDRGAQLAH